MKLQTTALEISIWKSTQRTEADSYFMELVGNNLTPEEMTARLQSLIIRVANINDPAVTYFYAKELSKLKLLRQRDFKKRVEGCCIEPVNGKEPKLESLNANHIAAEIQHNKQIIYLNEHFFLYEGGLYANVSEKEIDAIIKSHVREKFSIHLSKEVKASLAADTFKRPDEVNQFKDVLNLSNGMLDIPSFELKSHSPTYFSTRQLPCIFDSSAQCPKWIRFLEQVLGDDPFKIDILQEFFGYCLTSSTDQEKALMESGDGANGKSVTLNVLEGVIGRKNTSTVPLEQLRNSHYLARFFGSMVNISYETNAKTQVYESIFKQMTSGETVTADHKYGHPFSFKNTCKLIFAFNTMPRVDDTTDAFYRRIIPIPFNIQIPEIEQNKRLSEELLQEKSGILNWALEGLRRLKEQGRFTESPSVKELISDYRRDNNNVISFVEERCAVEPTGISTKQEFYKSYRDFCKEYGYNPLGMIKFGKRLKRHCQSVIDDAATDNVKIWKGIRLK